MATRSRECEGTLICERVIPGSKFKLQPKDDIFGQIMSSANKKKTQAQAHDAHDAVSHGS